jgi:hypothetical protein
MTVKDCWLTAKLLLAFASSVILGSESQGAHGLILLSVGYGSIQSCRYVCTLRIGSSYKWEQKMTAMDGTGRYNWVVGIIIWAHM